MRRTIQRFSAVVALVHFMTSPVQAQSVSPTDYEVPQSTAQQLRLGASYGYAGSGTDVQTNDGSASLLYNRFYNSLPFAFDLNFTGLGSTQRTVDDKQVNAYSYIAEAGVRKYFKPEGKLFYSFESRATGNDDFDRPSIDITPGVGYGRFIRVSPLAQAVRIEEFLLQENVIKGRLSRAVMIELGQVIEARPQYETEHGANYRIHWYEAMEKVIARSGKFTQKGFGAVGTLRIEEVLFQEHINERFVGWDARAGVRLEALTPDSDLDRQDPSLSLRFRYARPLGWKSQLDFSGQYSSPFTGDFGNKVYTLSGTVNYLYEISNRVDFTLSNIVTANRSDSNIDAALSEQLRSGFIFYIENQITLNVTGQFSKVRGEDAGQGLNLSLEYRLR